MPNYIAYRGRVQIDKHSLQVFEDGKSIRVVPDTYAGGDDMKLHAEFFSFDGSGKHEMMRSFEGQRVLITVEVES